MKLLPSRNDPAGRSRHLPQPFKPQAEVQAEGRMAVQVLPPLPVRVGLISPEVQSSSGQSLRLFMTNTGGQRIATGSQKPQFLLTFVTGSGPDAMATSSALRDASVTVAQQGANIDWSCVPVTSGTPSWELTATGSTLLGIGSQATVVFDITSLTVQQVGLTNLTITYAGLGAYSNGTVTLPVVKNPVPPSPVIVSLTAGAPTDPALTDSIPTVTLTYEVTGASWVMIREAGLIVPWAAGTQTITVPIAQSSTFTLVAGNSVGATASQALSVTMETSLYDVLPAGSILLWSGATSAIPDGWGLCDGSDGTNLVDMSGSFVAGAGNLYSANNSYAATQHSHSYSQVEGNTNLISGHVHGMSITWYCDSPDVGHCASVSSHTHGFSLSAGAVSLSTASGLIPKTTGLTYIMKTG